MLNQVMLIGNLGADPELRYTEGGMAVATLSVATNRKWKDKAGKEQEETTWHRVVVWQALAENCAKYLTKGRMVALQGRIRNGSYEKDGERRYYTEIQAFGVQFLPQGGGNRPPHPADTGEEKDSPDAGFIPDADVMDDDIPF